MFLAEINGKIVRECRDSEDYLTSGVFGQLRYLPPCFFWQELFQSSFNHDRSKNITETFGYDFAKYKETKFHFWPKCPGIGEPELLIEFFGGNQPPVAVLFEMKLWSGKSGRDENDQLASYLRFLDDLSLLNVNLVSAPTKTALIYLTPRDESRDLVESLAQSKDFSKFKNRLFSLRWQDMAKICNDRHNDSNSLFDELFRFLEHRGLTFFDGMRDQELAQLNLLNLGSFYNRDQIQTEESIFSTEHLVHTFPVIEAGWTIKPTENE